MRNEALSPFDLQVRAAMLAARGNATKAARDSGITLSKIKNNLHTKRQIDWWRGKVRGEWSPRARACARSKGVRDRKRARLAAEATASQVTQVTDNGGESC